MRKFFTVFPESLHTNSVIFFGSGQKRFLSHPFWRYGLGTKRNIQYYKQAGRTGYRWMTQLPWRRSNSCPSLRPHTPRSWSGECDEYFAATSTTDVYIYIKFSERTITSKSHNFLPTKRHGQPGNTIVSSSGRHGLNPRSVDLLSCPRISVILPRPSREMPILAETRCKHLSNTLSSRF
jgi:hypothetical protein